MSWVAGVFDSHGRIDRSRLQEASRRDGGTIVEQGPLRVLSNRLTLTRGALCLLNGCIDNSQELATELGQAPSDPLCEEHWSVPDGPVEDLLVAAYRRWGPELLPRLRGDFSLLLWDEQRGEGLLARDQLGVEAVFVVETAGGLSFASEIHHLLALLPTRPAPDPVGVAHWIAVKGREGPQTLYAGVRRLEPGSMLIFGRSRVWEGRYWAPRYSEPLACPPVERTWQVRSALERAVSRRLDPDGSTGVLMSGGLDSASVAALAAHLAPGEVRAYSGTFPDHPIVDERTLISDLRDRFDLAGATAKVRSGGLLASALESLAHSELPLLGWGDFWTVPLLRRALADGVAVTLGGDGGDELFGARAYLLADRLRAGRVSQAYGLARELPGAGDKPARRQVARVLADLALTGALPHGLHRRFSQVRRELPRWLGDSAARAVSDSHRPHAWKAFDGPRWWAHLAHGLTRGIEQTGVFEHQRLRAQALGVRSRHPLLDLDLIELSLRLEPQGTFHRHLSRPDLREAMAGLLPDSVRMRPAKAWFDSLIVDCLAGPDRPAIMRLLDSPDSQVRAYVDPGELRRTLLTVDPDAYGDRFSWMHQMWRLVTIECWLRRQADPGGPVLPPDVEASRARVELTARGRLSSGANRA